MTRPGAPRRHTRLPVRRRWPAGVSVLLLLATGGPLLPSVVATDLGMCTGRADPGAVWLLRGAVALAGAVVGLPFAVAAGFDAWRGAPDAARRMASAFLAVMAAGLLVAAGTGPATACWW